MGVPGLVNVENATGACGLALLAGANEDELRQALPTFQGIKRRFEYRIKSESLIYIDDYAHHPEEINATVSSVKAIYPDRKITVVFQPHLYTRTRDFVDGFAKALDQCDKVYLFDIYPAREEPIEGVTSHIILDKMIEGKAEIVDYNELVLRLKMNVPEVILSLGAGDIDKKVPDLERELKQFISN
jgi:UDP-N-acetylmuramate--alanine ligase